MKLITFKTSAGSSAGVAMGSQVLDLGHSAVGDLCGGARPRDVKAFLELGSGPRQRAQSLCSELSSSAGNKASSLRDAGALRSLDSLDVLAPILCPTVLLSCGRSYRQHVLEMQGPQAKLPEHPHAFLKNGNTVVGSGADIRIPPQFPDHVDYEGEFCVVIGSPCHNVSSSDAMRHVAGYTLINDVSARDWNTGSGTPNWEFIHIGKQLPTFCPMGPVVTTADEIPNPDDVVFEVSLNGKVMQKTSTSDLVFSIAQIVSYFSQWYPFMPGDVITTGTPSGVGFSRVPPIFMKEGDVVSVHSAPIGTLTNTVTKGH